jgi:hypothetical protein
MEQTTNKPSAYIAPGLSKRITQVIAEAWNIPEDMVLGNTDVINEKHLSPFSAPGKRKRDKGEGKLDYVNARKFYFYVMLEIKKYKYRELKAITGRKVAMMQYSRDKAIFHMAHEKDYMAKAQKVLDIIATDKVLFPKPIITIEANVTTIRRTQTDGDSGAVQLPETNPRPTGEHDSQVEEGIRETSGAA